MLEVGRLETKAAAGDFLRAGEDIDTRIVEFGMLDIVRK